MRTMLNRNIFWALSITFCLICGDQAVARDSGQNISSNKENIRSERDILRERNFKKASYKLKNQSGGSSKQQKGPLGGFSIQGARDFVNLIGARMVSLLQQKSLSRGQKEQRYRQILDDHFDMRRAGLYVLGGNVARSSDKQKVNEFVELFTQITVESYVDKFKKYNGQTLKLLNREVIRGNSLVVYSEIIQSEARKNNIDVQWYVTKKSNGSLMVKDLKVEGVSLLHTNRKNYMSTLREGGIDAGIARLKRELANYNRVGQS